MKVRSNAYRKTSYRKPRMTPGRRLGGSFNVRKKLHEYVTPMIKERGIEFIKKEKPALYELLKFVQQQSKGFKSPSGESGRSLNAVDAELIETSAVGATTESASMYFYRPCRKSHPAETVRYEYKSNRYNTIGNDPNAQGAGDINGMVLTPPKNDPDTENRYANISVKNIFDKILLNQSKLGTGEVNPQKEFASVHFESYIQNLMIKAPTQGAIVDIYDLCPKFGIGGSEVNAASPNPRYVEGYMSPLYAWNFGLQKTIDAEDTYTYIKLGSEPRNSLIFNRCWKVIKKTTVRMGNSSVHRHRSVFGINKTVTESEMAQCQSEGGMAPWTPTTLVVVRGYVTTGNTQAEATSVSLQCESSLSYRQYPGATTKVIVYDSTI